MSFSLISAKPGIHVPELTRGFAVECTGVKEPFHAEGTDFPLFEVYMEGLQKLFEESKAQRDVACTVVV